MPKRIPNKRIAIYGPRECARLKSWPGPNCRHKPHLGFTLKTGCSFRKGVHRKARPEIRVRNGMRFPYEPPTGNRVPLSRGTADDFLDR